MTRRRQQPPTPAPPFPTCRIRRWCDQPLAAAAPCWRPFFPVLPFLIALPTSFHEIAESMRPSLLGRCPIGSFAPQPKTAKECIRVVPRPGMRRQLLQALDIAAAEHHIVDF